MSVNLQDVKAFANGQLERAKLFATKIQFQKEAVQKSLILNEAFSIRASIGDDPDFAGLELGDGVAVWTSILSVDLRDSTKLADQIPPRDMYLMVHTLLPTLAYVCERSDGDVMNFRGDGLFAGFGLTKMSSLGTGPSRDQKLAANMQAVICGLRLIQAVRDAVEVVLSDDGIEVDLHAGVGIDCGHATVTRVGWLTAGELTAYGSCVNEACHLSNARDRVIVSPKVKELYPSGVGGGMDLNIVMGDGYAAAYGQSLLV